MAKIKPKVKQARQRLAKPLVISKIPTFVVTPMTNINAKPQAQRVVTFTPNYSACNSTIEQDYIPIFKFHKYERYIDKECVNIVHLAQVCCKFVWIYLSNV